MAQFAFDFQKNLTKTYRENNISENNFRSWSNQHMYKTSYGKMYCNKVPAPRDIALPKFGGFVPQIKAENKFAKSFTPITRDVYGKLQAENILKKSESFNWCERQWKNSVKDESLAGISHKFGKSTIQGNHPCQRGTEQNWISQSMFTYKQPNAQNNPTFRQTGQNLQLNKLSNTNSGFSQNSRPFDGKGFLPVRQLHGSMKPTEYRDQFNKAYKYHPNQITYKTRNLKKNEYNLKGY